MPVSTSLPYEKVIEELTIYLEGGILMASTRPLCDMVNADVSNNRGLGNRRTRQLSSTVDPAGPSPIAL